jgi:hypothetical protein
VFWTFCEFVSGNIRVIDCPDATKEKAVRYIEGTFFDSNWYSSVAVYDGETGECVYARFL